MRSAVPAMPPQPVVPPAAPAPQSGAAPATPGNAKPGQTKGASARFDAVLEKRAWFGQDLAAEAMPDPRIGPYDNSIPPPRAGMGASGAGWRNKMLHSGVRPSAFFGNNEFKAKDDLRAAIKKMPAGGMLSDGEADSAWSAYQRSRALGGRGGPFGVQQRAIQAAGPLGESTPQQRAAKRLASEEQQNSAWVAGKLRQGGIRTPSSGSGNSPSSTRPSAPSPLDKGYDPKDAGKGSGGNMVDPGRSAGQPQYASNNEAGLDASVMAQGVNRAINQVGGGAPQPPGKFKQFMAAMLPGGVKPGEVMRGWRSEAENRTGAVQYAGNKPPASVGSNIMQAAQSAPRPAGGPVPAITHGPAAAPPAPEQADFRSAVNKDTQKKLQQA